MDVIQSKNEYSLKNSVGQLKGSVRKNVQQIREKLLYHIAYIESALDDPEHYDLTGYSEELEQIVAEEKEKIQNLLKTAGDGKIIQEGIRTVILGKPNAGKSSLLNLLLGEDRAIVTDIAGTTRDVLEEYINLHGITLKIADTAGIRQTEDIVEKIGVSKAKEMAADADLILYVVDSSVPLDENDEEIIKILQEKKTIVLYSKTDLESAIDIEDLKSRINQPVIPISAKEETGITDLEEKIREMFFSGEIDFNDEVYITNERHRQELLKAQESLSLVENSIESGMPEDFYSIDLTDAYEVWDGFWENHLGKTLLMRYFLNFVWGNNNRMGCGAPAECPHGLRNLAVYAVWIAELRSYNRIDCGSLLYATWTAESRRG